MNVPISHCSRTQVTFSQPLAVGPVWGERFRELEALVNTGATYAWIPHSILEELGIVPEEQATFVLADGREVNYPIAQVRIRLEGRERFTVCIFGDEGTEPLLGSYTLEVFGLAVDPLNKRLIPVRGYLKKGGRSQ